VGRSKVRFPDALLLGLALGLANRSRNLLGVDLILWRHADAENSIPDLGRRLTERGHEQARRVAFWLKPRLPDDCTILVSPAIRTQQTATALGVPFATSSAVGTDTDTTQLLAAANWPLHPGALIVVGHQPTLGRVAAFLLSGREYDWNIAKGAVWWLRRHHDEVTLRAALDPDLL
jgi:phosphohistidine phosphatase